MEITYDFIKNELDGYYPNTTRITPKILSEMIGMLKNLHWTEYDFTQTLKQYRNDPLRMETRTLAVPPDVRQLISLWKKANAAPPINEVRTKPPAWYKGACAAMRENGRTGVAVYMLEQAQQPGSKLDLQAWQEEAEYCLSRETPTMKGNLSVFDTFKRINKFTPVPQVLNKPEIVEVPF